MQREDWLCKATIMFEDYFADNFFHIPNSVVLTLKCPLVNFPSLLWPHPKMKACSRYIDGFVEIFISPDITCSCNALDTLVHQLVHVVVGRETPHLLTGYISGNHKEPFMYVANCIGLFHNRHTVKLECYFQTIIEEIGIYPGELV